MTSEAAIIERIQFDLRGPGGDWETTFEDVLGESLLVFKNRHRSIREMFNANIAKWASREFLVLGDRRITYEELKSCVESTAYSMQTQCGIKQGDRVAILGANSPKCVAAKKLITHSGEFAPSIATLSPCFIPH